MQSGLKNIFRFVAAGLLFAAGAASVDAQVVPEFQTAPRSLITQKLDRSQMVPTIGAMRSGVSSLQDLGEVSGSLPMEHIQLMLQRPSERQAAFDAQTEALHLKGNVSYHKWLTPAIVGSEFGLSDSDVTTLTSYLQAEGFTVNFVSPSKMLIDFTGTAAQVEHSFHTQIHNVQEPSGKASYSAVTDASIPEALAPAIRGFVSLGNALAARPMMRKPLPVEQTGAYLAQTGGVRPMNTETYKTDTLYDVGAQDFYTIYNENPLLLASTPIDGTGETVAQIEETDINTADVTSFRQTFNVIPNAPSLTVMHGAGTVTCGDPGILNSRLDDEEPEAALDVEWAGAVAPRATLLFMSCASTTTAGIFLSAEAIIYNNLANTMSLSYGEYEGGSTSEDTLSNELWEEAASQGETVVVSSGDSGSDARDQDADYASHGINVSGFASTAWNVSAGGTDFQDGYNQTTNANDSAYGISNYWSSTNGAGYLSALSYVPETAWNDTCAGSLVNFAKEDSTDPLAFCDTSTAVTKYAYTETGGGSGGVSTINARPSWQAGGTVYGISAASTSPYRLQPDVSLFASNGFWGHILDYYESDETTTLPVAGLQISGGTSFVAPQLAGVFALINQSTGERQGQPNYVLYAMAGLEFGTTTSTGSCDSNGAGVTGIGVTTAAPAGSCIFYDVETGNNSQACKNGTTNCISGTDGYGVLSSTASPVDTPAYPSTPGYDLATGLGSINIANLVTNWQSPTVSQQFTPTVLLTDTTATTVAYGNTESLIATVSGSGSYPTGSVLFTYTGPSSGTVGTAALTGSSGCSTASTCTEAATESIYPAATPSATPYVFTAKYNTTNENYVSATSGTVSVTVTRQTPALAVQNVSIITGTATATLTATITYVSSTGSVAPTGTTPFTVTGGSGGTVTGSCTTTSSTVVTCTATYPTSTLGAGNYPIKATYSGDSNYSAITTAATGTLNVGSGTAPTITFSITSPHYTMYPTVPLTYTSNSSGAVTYSISGTTGTADGAISGSTLTLTAAGSGTITVQLSQASAGSYRAGTSSSTFTVYAGSVWVADSTDDISTFAQPTGTAITASPGLSGGGVGTIPFPQAEAFDASGDLWIASSTGVSEFKPSASGPVAVSSTPYTGGGITTPLAVAVDGLGVIWIANDNGTISALTNTGTAVSPSTGYTASGVAAKYTNVGGIAIDLSGSVWVTNTADGSVTQVLGVAAPVAPISTSLTNGTTGTRP